MRSFTIEEVSKAIELANLRQSKLTEEILSLDGNENSPRKVRCLLNNLVTSNDKYLEVGSWRGASCISAIYKNNVRHYNCIDSFCQTGEGNRQILENNFRTIIGAEPNLIEQDSFAVDLEKMEKDFTVYFYDGFHSFDAQKQALTYYYPVLADEFLLIVDDWDTQGWGVQEGTYAGIMECKLNVAYKVELHNVPGRHLEEWWNGLGIFILRK